MTSYQFQKYEVPLSRNFGGYLKDKDWNIHKRTVYDYMYITGNPI